VRVALIGTDLDAAPRPGARIRVYARLLPPGGPVEPGAFDFRRKAFFEGLGGVGYARGPVLDLGTAASAGARDAARLWLAGARMRLADGIRAALPGREGAFAAAIVTGDRSAIGEAEAEALRAANLSHLLAISGLHMGILTGLVFLALRLLFAAIPGLVLRYPVKKVAAAGALVAGAAYLAVAGATVATQRAFLMAAVVFVAVMLDRPAITLRALALAAVLVLLVHPVSLFDVGFQMSFAATTALVAGFEAFGRRGGRAAGRRPQGTAARIGRRIALYAGGVLVTSLVAGLATAPFAAFHFNRLAPYGLPANLAAVPVMGLWIAPAAILSALAAPFGLAEWPLALMGAGIGWVLAVAETVAGWPGAWRPVAAAPGAALLAIALGGLWLALWRSRVRLAGLAGLALGLGLWIGGTERPAVLLAPGARLVGVMGPEGRVVDHPRAQSYAAGTWLRRDGEPAPQEVAVARPGMAHGRGWARADLAGGWRLEVVHGRRPGRERLRALCREGVLLVARHGPPVDGPCRYLGERALDRGGAVAVRIGPEGPRITWSRDPTRRRPWLPAGEIPAR
jgi:competence protein ComEC